MTNEEYVLLKYKDIYNNIEDLIKTLCPCDFDENIKQFDGCDCECSICWSLDIEDKFL